MHWLHVNPNSDFSTFRHFFGTFLEEFWSIFCRYFAKKILETWHLSFFLADNLRLADFQHFFGKVLAHIWKERSIWQTFGIWFLFFFWILGQILEENLTKNSRKSAEKSRNRNSDLRVANACSVHFRLDFEPALVAQVITTDVTILVIFLEV